MRREPGVPEVPPRILDDTHVWPVENLDAFGPQLLGGLKDVFDGQGDRGSSRMSPLAQRQSPNRSQFLFLPTRIHAFFCPSEAHGQANFCTNVATRVGQVDFRRQNLMENRPKWQLLPIRSLGNAG